MVLYFGSLIFFYQEGSTPKVALGIIRVISYISKRKFRGDYLASVAYNVSLLFSTYILRLRGDYLASVAYNVSLLFSTCILRLCIL